MSLNNELIVNFLDIILIYLMKYFKILGENCMCWNRAHVVLIRARIVQASYSRWVRSVLDLGRNPAHHGINEIERDKFRPIWLDIEHGNTIC